jgi:hypothetical protein
VNAEEIKAALYSRHPGHGGKFPGPWTVTEEYRGIDLLAVSAWASAGSYARVGYEVKVSRSDMRGELLRPGKRYLNVQWCNEFYFAVPSGLYRPEELEFEEPEWGPGDFHGPRCPGFAGVQCMPWGRGRKTHRVRVARPTTSRYDLTQVVTCPTCGGKGSTGPSRVEEEAPTLWVPRDVGLVVVSEGGGSRCLKRALRRKEVPAPGAAELGQLVRWVSMRPDPRHRGRA